ncbi:HAD family hydrolase [Gordonia hydrophobica]|uniref:HAD hydrolase-like protein n=1 Tax=Gordonia hydrophobica TaxID=40516 RepID=A0ABZ2U7M5_9ACTN|nr:HAD hydrolase-like protein [Gordonia hydrophobica]MBM7365392.1 phosphoglycolate phosphatase [Gordonia hydrophobica]
MCSPPKAVIFDLDGTLVQTRESSWKVFSPINSRHQLGIDTAEQFYELFAHNFFGSLRRACGDPATADVVTAEFMQALNEHYSPTMVPGLNDVVTAMVPHSKLAVLSSNTTAVVRRILRQNRLEYCFAHVFGGDVEPDKTIGIARFLADAATGSGRMCRAYYDEPSDSASDVGGETGPRDVVLITDTVGDVEAAVSAGIRAVGVAWGMHTEEQLIAAGAEFVAIWPQELLAYLYSDAEPACGGSCATRHADPPSASVREASRSAAEVRHDRRRRTAAKFAATSAASAVTTSALATPALAVSARALNRVPPPVTARVDDRLLAAIGRTMR